MRTRRSSPVALTAIIGCALICATTVQATSLKRPLNLAELVANSPTIVAGTVTEVATRQVDRMVFDEISLRVETGIRGANAGSTITFRQLNLHASRPAENGRVYLGALPGMPRFAPGEHVLLFLSRIGPQNLGTTVGLEQGKFVFGGTNVQNNIQNRGLFRDLDIGGRTLSVKEKAMLATTKGRVHGDTFIQFLERAVTENWWPTRKAAAATRAREPRATGLRGSGQSQRSHRP